MHELSHEIEIDTIKPQGETHVLEASQAQCTTVAAWLDIPEIHLLRGKVRLHLTRDILTVSGTVEGRFLRLCGVCLEMFEELIDEQFSFELLPVASASISEMAPGDLDGPDYWPDEVVDVGDILVQQASLAMMAHPRKPNARKIDDPNASALPSAFAVLEEMVLKE